MAILNTSAPPRARRRLGGWFRVWLITLAWWQGCLVDVRAQAANPKEYQLKAVFLYNFAQFTEWPPDAFADANSPVIIGILGDNPFGSDLDAVVRGEKVNGHPLVVKSFRQVGEIKACHVLFISQSETRRMDEILTSLRSRSILTVGEVDGFSQRGGMIRFTTESNKIRLRINTTAAKAGRLSISSKLLRLAEIVPAGRD